MSCETLSQLLRQQKVLCTWHFIWVQLLNFKILELIQWGRMCIWDTEERLDLQNYHFLIFLWQLVKELRTLPEDIFTAEAGFQARNRPVLYNTGAISYNVVIKHSQCG